MFDIFKQFCYLAKYFVYTCKTYKYAKAKTSSLQNYILLSEINTFNLTYLLGRQIQILKYVTFFFCILLLGNR